MFDRSVPYRGGRASPPPPLSGLQAGAPSRARGRGVYFTAAPAGYERVVAVDSSGDTVAEWFGRIELYSPLVGQLLRQQLDAVEPARPPLRLVTDAS